MYKDIFESIRNEAEKRNLLLPNFHLSRSHTYQFQQHAIHFCIFFYYHS